jgi:hypothetical protein
MLMRMRLVVVCVRVVNMLVDEDFAVKKAIESDVSSTASSDVSDEDRGDMSDVSGDIPATGKGSGDLVSGAESDDEVMNMDERMSLMLIFSHAKEKEE